MSPKLPSFIDTETSSSGGFIGVISDIHGNVDALDAVFADARTQGVISMICLGDIIGYGPEPGACLQLVREACDHVVMGNHEMMMLMIELGIAKDMGPELTPALQLALSQLSTSDLKWVKKLPLGIDLEVMGIVHASFYEPENFHYILESNDAEHCVQEQPGNLSFHGHTHEPVIWEVDLQGAMGFLPNAKPYSLRPDTRYSINVGSVGQPRDGDSRATYCIFDPHTSSIWHRRVQYDIAKAQSRFERTHLRAFDRDRLLAGH